MVEDMSCELDQCLPYIYIQHLILASDDAQNFVIDLVIFDLLHQGHRIALDYVTATQLRPGQHEAINVVSIIGAGIHNKSIRKRVRARNWHCSLEFQSLLV